MNLKRWIAYINSGLTTGAIAAIPTILASLPIKSPDDIMLNSITVSLGVLLAGVMAGISWGIFSTARKRPYILYILSILGIYFLVVLTSVAIEIKFLEYFIVFVVSLTTISFIIIGLITPIISRTKIPTMWWPAPVCALIIFGLGISLSGQGDQESGRLSLPIRTASTVNKEVNSTSKSDANDKIHGWIIIDGSEVTFTVKERLAKLPLPNDAVVRTNGLTGELHIDEPSVIRLDLHSLKSDQQYRDRYIRTKMFPNSPTATFTVEKIGEVPDMFYKGEKVIRQVNGTLDIRGTTVPLTFELEVRNDGNILNIVGRTTFSWEQLQIPVPSARSVLWVDDNVKVEILILGQPKP